MNEYVAIVKRENLRIRIYIAFITMEQNQILNLHMDQGSKNI